MRLSILAVLPLLCLQACAPDTAPSVTELASQRPDASFGPLYRSHIGDADLPPGESRSLLDLWLAEQGAIPFPFDQFLQALAREDRESRLPRTVLIPDGRSLLKADADFERPRVVVATDMRPPEGALLPADFRGRMFLGFTEGANEIEAISYNPAAGRYEFQLITDYCEGCNPRLVYAKRAICLTCHQGAVPIFPVRPWEETNAQPDVAAAIAAARSSPYLGLPHRVPLEQPEAIDNLTNQAAVLVATQHAWLDGCGSGPEGAACRRALLRHALAWLLNPAALDQDMAALTQAQSRQWPEQGIPVADNDLASRNPFDSPLYQDSFWGQLRHLLWGSAPRQRTGDKLQDFDNLPALPAEFDPLSLRPPSSWMRAGQPDAALGVALLFTPADKALLEKAFAYRSEALLTAVDALPQSFFEPAPLRRESVLQALLSGLEQASPRFRFADLGPLSAPILEGEPPLELAVDSPLQPFAQYCFACHRGNPAQRLNFLAGADEDEVLRNLREVQSISEVLDWERYLGTRKEGQLMPPADSWQRRALEESLQKLPEGGENPLEQMRAQVPSLFDF